MIKKILIVEDEKIIAELERDYLEANGYEADIASDGLLAIKMLEDNNYSLVLVDIMLPGMNGFELCKNIREKKDIPILFVSAKKEDIDKIRGLRLGADDYIVKPFSPSELVARVHAHINRYERLTAKGHGAIHSMTEIGNLKIDIDARRVFINRNEVMLTNKEFDLLVFLSTNPNIVFSKNELFNKIWGLDSMGETSTVTVHINRIREKIEDDSANPQYIETVWGVGYRFKM
jgi:DNA-binding response OmpR family regulator